MKSINFTWWNLQNLFDTDDDPISLDLEYTAENGWTQEVFEAKLANLATVLSRSHGGLGPDLLAVCEIEKDTLLEKLVKKAGLDKLKVVKDTTGTRDLRGIDVGAAYNSEIMELLDVQSHSVHLRYPTRDILEMRFRIIETREEFSLIACHFPSRRMGKYRSEPSRIAVAENIAYLVESLVKYNSTDYEMLREAGDLVAVQNRWDYKVLVAGDFNDEPFDRSLMEHLNATGDMERVTGETNDIDKFEKETANYRQDDIFVFNATWKFMSVERAGTFFIDGTMDGERFGKRYQMLDQILATRGLLLEVPGLRLDHDSVRIFAEANFNATKTIRPIPFDRKTKRGYSDHFPLEAKLLY